MSRTSETTARARAPIALYALIGGLVLALAAAIWFGFFAAGTPAASGAATQASADADKAVAAAGIDPKQRSAMEAIVRDYLLKHPEVIAEAVDILNDREKSKRVAEVRAQAERPFPGAFAGDPNGDVVLVEFTDYNCGYCRASAAVIDQLLAADKRLKVVFRELPILSPTSKDAALWALAAAEQGKYKAFHDAMFSGVKPSNASIEAAAKQAGLDMDRARTFTKSPQAQAELAGNLDLARSLGFGGTPTFLVGGRMLEGQQSAEALKDAIAAARRN